MVKKISAALVLCILSGVLSGCKTGDDSAGDAFFMAMANAGKKNSSNSTISVAKLEEIRAIKTTGSVSITGLLSVDDIIQIRTAVNNAGDSARIDLDFTGATFPGNVVPADAFKNCKKLNYVNIPNTVTEIGDSAFNECQNLRLTIPSSVKKIGSWSCCGSNLTLSPDSDLSGLKEIGAGCFAWSALSTFTIPEGVTSLTATFTGSGSLYTVYIPKSVKEFTDCPSKDDTVNGSWGVFEGCWNLRNIYYAGTYEEWNKIKKSADWKAAIYYYLAAPVPATGVYCKDDGTNYTFHAW